MAIRRFHWDPVDDCVMHETDGNGDTIVQYTHEPGHFGPLLSENRGGVESYHHHDALGSTTMLTNDSGAVTDTFQYDAWGGQVARTGTTPTPYTWIGKWGYQDDSATIGGYHVRERPYEPIVARWSAPDPLGIEESPNLYEYTSNRPLTSIDPSGLAEDEDVKELILDAVFNYLESLLKYQICAEVHVGRFQIGKFKIARKTLADYEKEGVHAPRIAALLNWGSCNLCVKSWAFRSIDNLFADFLTSDKIQGYIDKAFFDKNGKPRRAYLLCPLDNNGNEQCCETTHKFNEKDTITIDDKDLTICRHRFLLRKAAPCHLKVTIQMDYDVDAHFGRCESCEC